MRAWLPLVVMLLGCGARVIDGRHVEAIDDASSSDSSTSLDSSTTVDSAVTDSVVTVDVEPVDSGPPVCDTPVAPDFSCPMVPSLGAKVCTDVQIKALMDACFGTTGESTACNNARMKYPACGKCVLQTFITPGGYLEVGTCMKKVKPASDCASSTDCLYACWADACSSCDPTPMGGSSEYDDCLARQSVDTGSCWEFGAKDYSACTSDPDLSVCVPASVDDLLPFFRGGCRDNGDWSKANVKDGTL